MSQQHWACPSSRRVYPPCPHCSGSRLLHRELSEAGPGLHAPPRSKPLRFRHSGSPQGRRIGWACVLCPSQVRIAQVFGKRGRCDLSPLPSLLLSFPGLQLAPLLRRMVTVQNPKKSQLAKKPACSLSLWGCYCPLLALPAVAVCHQRGMLCSRLILFRPLFCVQSWQCLMLELFAW